MITDADLLDRAVAHLRAAENELKLACHHLGHLYGPVYGARVTVSALLTTLIAERQRARDLQKASAI